MSYLVFARKWRPQKFDDIVGQEHITRTLRKAIEKDRVAHAYIFTGTRGVGKTTSARILARALNCDRGPTPDPCGECDSCRSILSGSSFDVLEIDGASNNSVEDIRDLRENVAYSSMGGKYRIFVIDEVHMLSKQAFNALLKTLEEPPKNVIFIFATTEPRKIPETIHSRCQRYDFRRISTEQILSRLEHICTSEGIPFERQALAIVAAKADGSMRDALSLLDQVYSFCQESIGEREVRSVLGLVDLEINNGIFEAIAGRKPEPVLLAVQTVLYHGYDLQEFLHGLQDHLRNLLFSRLPGIFENRRTSLHIDNPEVAQTLRRQAQVFPETTLLRMIEVLRKAESEMKWSSFPRFVVELALLKLVYLDSTVSVEQLLDAYRGFSGASAVDPASPGAVELSLPSKKKSDLKGNIPCSEQQPRTPPPLPREEAISCAPDSTESAPAFIDDGNAEGTPDLKVLWPRFIDHLLHDRPNLGSFLSLAYLASASDGSLDLRFKNSFRFQFNEVTRKGNRELIEQKLREFAGREIALHMTMEAKQGEGKAPAVALAAIGPSIDDDIAHEPIIETVLELFDGEIIP